MTYQHRFHKTNARRPPGRHQRLAGFIARDAGNGLITDFVAPGDDLTAHPCGPLIAGAIAYSASGCQPGSNHACICCRRPLVAGDQCGAFLVAYANVNAVDAMVSAVCHACFRSLTEIDHACALILRRIIANGRLDGSRGVDVPATAKSSRILFAATKPNRTGRSPGQPASTRRETNAARQEN